MTARFPIVIAHRGASGYRPEHTLASYWLAIQQGADYIEPDLVSTRDGVLVARHENEISSTTDVAERPEFRARYCEKRIDGRLVSGYFTEDFSWAELATLRAKERLPALRSRNCAYDGQLRVPRFEQILRLARIAQRRYGRRIGVYPETKHPSYFASIGLPLEPALLRALQRYGQRGRQAAVFIQSFEVENLKRLRAVTDLPLVQLIDLSGQPFDVTAAGGSLDYPSMLGDAGLREVARYAAAIGVHKQSIVPWDGARNARQPTQLVAAAHAVGLRVHAWTLRLENEFMPRTFQRGDPSAPGFAALPGALAEECAQLFELGVDGLFCDQPGLAVHARNAFWARG